MKLLPEESESSLKIRNSNNSHVNDQIRWLMNVFEHFLFFITMTWKLINIINKLFN